MKTIRIPKVEEDVSVKILKLESYANNYMKKVSLKRQIIAGIEIPKGSTIVGGNDEIRWENRSETQVIVSKDKLNALLKYVFLESLRRQPPATGNR